MSARVRELREREREKINVPKNKYSNIIAVAGIRPVKTRQERMASEVTVTAYTSNIACIVYVRYINSPQELFCGGCKG